MPSTSAKQAKFMRAVAHSPKFAKKVGVSQSVGKDFEMADKKMKKFGDGGEAKKPAPKPPLKEAPGNRDPYEPIPKTGPEKPKQKLGRFGKMGYKEGGKVMKKSDKAGRALVKKSADTMGRAMKMNKGGKCYAKGGLVGGHKSADGIAKKGKTKGKMV
jgi:hypothetical protein